MDRFELLCRSLPWSVAESFVGLRDGRHSHGRYRRLCFLQPSVGEHPELVPHHPVLFVDPFDVIMGLPVEVCSGRGIPRPSYRQILGFGILVITIQ